MPRESSVSSKAQLKEEIMSGIIYLVGLVVVILAILSFLGLR
jgi:predicted membrane channel-forming protein YqfA (hemolysin III family)